MRILGLDVETTGLDPATCEITELGLVLWDWEKKKVLKIANHLMKPSKPIPAEITRLTGISDDDFEFAEDPNEVLENFLCMLISSDYIMAHNAQFDRSFMKNFCPEIPKGWLCSREDIKYDDFIHKSKSLVTLAATHGFLNPFPHRATFDVLTMLKVASQYDIHDIIKRSLTPVLTLHSQAPFERKDEVKAAGFYWEAKDKVWWTRVKECDYTEGMYAFPVRVAKREEAV
jgi:DNA polymerase-3 subunit epsilon